MIGGLFNISFCLIFTLFFVACSVNQPQYVDSRDFVSFGLDNHDIGDILQKQVDSLLNHPSIKKQNEPKVLTIGAIENKTNDNIDIEIIANELTRHLSNSGKFVIVNAGRDKKIEQIIKDSRKLRQNAEYNQYTTIEQGNLIAPHYALTGKITQRIKQIGDDEINEYVFSFTLTDLQLGAVRWVDTKQISKKLPKKEVENFSANLTNQTNLNVPKQSAKSNIKSSKSTAKPTQDSRESTTNSNINELIEYELNHQNHFIFGFDFSLLNKGFLDAGNIYANVGRKNYAIISTSENEKLFFTYPLNIRIGYLRDIENFGIAINAVYNFSYAEVKTDDFTLNNVSDYYKREYMRDLDINGKAFVQKVGGEIVGYWRPLPDRNKIFHLYLGIGVNKAFYSKSNIQIRINNANDTATLNIEPKLNAIDGSVKFGGIWYVNKSLGVTYEWNFNMPFGNSSLTSGFGWLVFGLQGRI